jgi:hypothetical protein
MQGRQFMWSGCGWTGWIRNAAVLATAAIAMSVGSASAAIIPLSVEEIVAHSDEVVTGRVAAEQEVIFTRGRIFTVSEFIVDQSLKGDRQPGESIQIAIPGGELDGIGMMATNIATLKPNEEAVLFLEKRSEPELAAVAQSLDMPEDHLTLVSPRIIAGPQGKFSIVKLEEPRKQGDQVVGFDEVTRVVREVPGRRISVSDYPKLDDFEAAIRRIVEGQVPVRRSVRLTPDAEPVDVAERDPAAKALRIFDPVNIAPPTVKGRTLPAETDVRRVETPQEEAEK